MLSAQSWFIATVLGGAHVDVCRVCVCLCRSLDELVFHSKPAPQPSTQCGVLVRSCSLGNGFISKVGEVTQHE